MTTIATDGRTIAADGQSTCNGERLNSAAVKIKTAHGSIYGMVGTAAVFDAAIQWHQTGADPEKVPKFGDWTLLVISRARGLQWYSNDMPFSQSLPYPMAFGSGDKYALGALAAGMTPEKAVEIATRYDINSGGRIMVLDIAKELGIHSIKAVSA